MATNNIGKYYHLLNDDDNALIYFKEAYEVSLKDSIYSILEESSHKLGTIYLRKNRQKEAIEYIQLNIKHKQKIINKKEGEILAWLSSEREIYKVEMNNLNLTKENELHQMEVAQGKKTNTLLVVLLLVVLFSLFFAIRSLKERKKKNTKLSYLNSNLKSSIATIQMQSLDIEKKNKLLNNQKKKLVVDLKEKVMLTTNNQNLLQILHKKIKESDIQVNTKKAILKEIDSTSNRDILKDLNYELLSLHEEFYAKMSKRFPSLTINNLKLCVLIKMNLTTKEIAQLSFITYDSAKIARNRLRKKLDIADPNIKLITYLNSIDKEGVET